MIHKSLQKILFISLFCTFATNAHARNQPAMALMGGVSLFVAGSCVPILFPRLTMITRDNSAALHNVRKPYQRRALGMSTVLLVSLGFSWMRGSGYFNLRDGGAEVTSFFCFCAGLECRLATT